MSIKKLLIEQLIPFCIELGYVEFDNETIKNRLITANSQVVEWKVPKHEVETAIEYLKIHYPDVKDDIIVDVVKEYTV